MSARDPAAGKSAASDLADRSCAPCKKGTPPLGGDALAALAAQLPEGWSVVDDHHLERAYKLRNFVEALGLVNRIGAIAEAEGHHPDLELSWGRVRVTICTHRIDGLTESDFVLAAKIERAASA